MQKINFNKLSLIVIIVLGFSLIIIGELLNEKYKLSTTIFSILGSVLVGGGLSALFSSFLTEKLLNQIKEISAKNISPMIYSNNSDVQAYRKKKFHYYDMTITKNGENDWRYELFDFTKAFEEPGKLVTISENIYPGKKRYIICGGIRDRRLILVRKCLSDDEPDSVLIFPDTTHDSSIYYGIAIKQTREPKTQALTPCILSENVIEGWEGKGRLDRKKMNKVYRNWYDNFWDQNPNNMISIVGTLGNDTTSFDIFWTACCANRNRFEIEDDRTLVVKKESVFSFWFEAILYTEKSWDCTRLSNVARSMAGIEERGITLQGFKFAGSSTHPRRIFIFDSSDTAQAELDNIKFQIDKGIAVRWIAQDMLKETTLRQRVTLFNTCLDSIYEEIGTKDFALIDNKYIVGFILDEQNDIICSKVHKHPNLCKEIGNRYDRLWDEALDVNAIQTVREQQIDI